MMRSLLFLLIGSLALVLMVGEAGADEDSAWRRQEWYFNSESSWDSDYGRVDISADGDYIVAGSSEGEIYLFDKDEEGQASPLWEYDTGGVVQSIAISSNGKYIAAISTNGNLYLFSKNSNTPLWNYSIGCCGGLHSVGISKNGGYIAAGAGMDVYLFDKDSSTPLWNYTLEQEVISVVIADNGDYIAAGDRQGRIYLFDKDSSTPLWIFDELELSLDSNYLHVSISADGGNVVAGMSVASDCAFYVFNKNSNNSLWSYTAESSSESWCPVAISADGDYIAAGSGKRFYLFDKDSSKPLWDYVTTGSYATSVAISEDGDYIVAGSSGADSDDNEDSRGKIYLFDSNDDNPLWHHDSSRNTPFSNSYETIGTVAISADGDYIVAGNTEGVKFITKEDTVLGKLSEFFGEWGINSIVVLGILAGLFQFRKDTGIEDPTNKLLRIGLYGVSILTLLVSLPILLIGGGIEGNLWGCLPGFWVLMFAILFAVTGSFLGHETYDSGPSYSYKSSIPSSKPIFADRRVTRVTPMFEPENELTTIECPGCNAQMDVPKLGKMQNVTCNECGLSGEIEI